MGNTDLKKLQAEKLSEIGSRLSESRLEQLLTLEQVASKTMMQTKTLKAIESGDLSQLPESIYIRGFISRYASALGFDGTKLADEFPVEPTLEPSIAWNDTPVAQLRPLHLYWLYAAVITLAISALSYFLQQSTSPIASLSPSPVVTPSPSPSVTPSPSPVINSSPFPVASLSPSPVVTPSPSPLVTPSPSPSVTPSPSPTLNLSGQPIQVNLTCKGQAWISVEVDNKFAFEGILPEGTQRNWKANREILLRSGNAGAVLVSVNGGVPKPMGEPGAVEELKLSSQPTPPATPSPRPTLTPR